MTVDFIFIGNDTSVFIIRNDVFPVLLLRVEVVRFTVLILICFVLPGVLTWLIGIPCRKAGWIKDGDLKLEN